MTNEELKCKVCGKLARDDCNFYPKQCLCNRHYLQLHIHGKFLDDKLICNKDRKEWTAEEIDYVEEMYKKNVPLKTIAEHLGTTINSVSSLAGRTGISSKYIKHNNAKFKAPYQDYNWCFERFINKNMSHQEMADELGVSKRVIQKWCVEIHHIHDKTYQHLKHLTDIQKRVAIVGTLGDGHISKKDHNYIESHAIDEKDYLFWKYSIFKDLCYQEPTYYPAKETNFGTEKTYMCQPFYRFTTRRLDDFETIRTMPRIDKINMMDKLMFCIHMLDDGSRDGIWHICLAEWSDEEQSAYISKCEEFGLNCKRDKDSRYLHFTAYSSKKIDEMIVENIPNDLDIIRKKIFENDKILPCAHYKFVIVDGRELGLSTYYKNNPEKYLLAKKYYENNRIESMNIEDLEKVLEAS